MEDPYWEINCTYYNSLFPLLLQTPAVSSLRDVTLVCEDKKIPVHKFMLVMFSKHFEKVFTDTPNLDIFHFFPNVDYEDVDAFLNYIYTGTLIVKRSRFYPVMKLFNDFRVRGLSDPGDGIPDYKALIAALSRNNAHVHDRENPDSSANTGLTSQPSENDQASIAVVDQVSKDDHQGSLPSAATVGQDVYNVPDVNHQDHVLAPPSVDPIHNISYPSPPALETKQQWETPRPRRKQVKCMADVDSEGSISSSPSKPYAFSGQQDDSPFPANAKCLFCESFQPSKLIKVGREGRKMLMKECRQIDEEIYEKLLNKRQLYLHGECKRKYLNSKTPKKSPNPIKVKRSEDFDIDSDSPASKMAPAGQTLKPQWQMPDPVKKKMTPVQDVKDPQPCSSSFRPEAKCVFCQGQHPRLIKSKCERRERFRTEVCKRNPAMCDVLTNAVDIYYHKSCVPPYLHSVSARKAQEKAIKKHQTGKKKCIFCQREHGSLSNMRLKTRKKLCNETFIKDKVLRNVLTKETDVYHHFVCMKAYVRLHPRKKSRNTKKKVNKKP